MSAAPDKRRGVLAGRVIPVVATGVVVVGVMVATLWLVPETSRDPSRWAIGPDVWTNFQLAHLTIIGAYSALYDGAGYLAPPALPLVLAPVWELSHLLGLAVGYEKLVPRPSAWYLLGPTTALLCSLELFAADSLAGQFGASRGRRIALAGFSAIALWTIVAWGHPEDAIAVGFLLYAVGQGVRERWVRCAWLLAAAFAFQPLVALAIPVVLGAAPLRRLPSIVARILAPTILMLVGPMIVNPTQTMIALVEQPAIPSLGRPTPWLHLTRPILHEGLRAQFTGGPPRLIAVLIALGLGVLVHRRRPDGLTVTWLVACALALRTAFDPVVLPYYTWPAIATAVIVAAAGSPLRLGATFVAGALTTIVSDTDIYAEKLWWWILLALATTMIASSDLGRQRSAISPAVAVAGSSGAGAANGGQLWGGTAGEGAATNRWRAVRPALR